MTAKRLGNHGPYLMHGINGSGTDNNPDLSIGWNQIMGKAGDYTVLSAFEVHGRDLIHRGYFFQGDGNAGYEVAFTLANQGIAKDPEMQTVVPWTPAPTGALTNLPSGAITDSNLYWYEGAFACVKITFTAPGIMWIVAR